jgi:hypothetical protein
MTKKILPALLLAALVLTLPSCETDVDINTDWKEITIAYGLLNQLDSAHYLRINKAFLGGDALQIAKIEDSSSYKNNLEVVMEGWNSSGPQQTITFDTVTISNKDSGLWYNPYMLVYKGLGDLNPDLQYRLNIRNTSTGHMVTSQTNLINDFFILKPVAGGRLTLFRGFSTSFEWRNGRNAKRYEPIVRFHYFEIPQNTSDTIPKYLDWVLSTVTSDNLEGSGESSISFSNDGFYDFVNNRLSDDFSGRRLAGKVDFIISAGGEEYETYMRVNGPSYSLVQDRPEYTNIENGLGLFSSRYSVEREKSLDPRAEDEIIELQVGFVKNPNL